jgi:hypothetical protein
MRSSKSRSRSKSNRNNRQVGNIVNRVFDSSGPEGKVRGTPQQIIDKYNQLARDSQLSGDRVATENFQQHAEHYLRMLAEAQREQAERQAQQQQNQQNNQGNQNNNNAQNNQQDGGQNRQNDQQRNNNNRRDDRGNAAGAEQKSDAPAAKSDDVIDMNAGSDAGLVETPEGKQSKPKRSRKKPEAEAATEAPVETAPPDAAE